MNVETRLKIEKRIVRKIVKNALAKNWLVSVSDGEDWTVIKSKNYAEINDALFTTDEDALLFHDADNNRIGIVVLVYGNDGWDVVSDHTASEVMDEFMKPIDEMSDKICLQYH